MRILATFSLPCKFDSLRKALVRTDFRLFAFILAQFWRLSDEKLALGPPAKPSKGAPAALRSGDCSVEPPEERHAVRLEALPRPQAFGSSCGGRSVRTADIDRHPIFAIAGLDSGDCEECGTATPKEVARLAENRRCNAHSTRPPGQSSAEDAAARRSARRPGQASPDRVASGTGVNSERRSQDERIPELRGRRSRG